MPQVSWVNSAQEGVEKIDKVGRGKVARETMIKIRFLVILFIKIIGGQLERTKIHA